MTCIIAVKTKYGFVMGADSVGTNMETYNTITHPKLFQLGDFTIGYCGSFRFGKLLQYRLIPPAHADGISDDAYINGAFSDAVRKCLEAGGFSTIKDNREESYEATGLFGYHGKVWIMTESFAFIEVKDEVIADGSGYIAAIASVKALLKHTSMTTDELIEEALKIVEETILTVKGPFEIIHGFFETEEKKNES